MKPKNLSYPSADYLAHHGVAGQRWGRRQYQNEDGSLTPEGREHYGVGPEREKTAKEKAKEKKNNYVNAYKERNDKDITQMSDEELKKAFNRQNLENNYRDALRNSEGSKYVNAEEKFKNQLKGNAAMAAAVGLGAGLTAGVMQKMGGADNKKAFGVGLASGLAAAIPSFVMSSVGLSKEPPTGNEFKPTDAQTKAVKSNFQEYKKQSDAYNEQLKQEADIQAQYEKIIREKEGKQ